MTAMPPTTGHLQLVQFANLLADETIVILCTQPEEPFPFERASALKQAVRNHNLKNTTIVHFHKKIPQNPHSPGFRQMWKRMLIEFGVTGRDYIVASEAYGQWVADIVGARFYPYDIDRSINHIKASKIRNNPTLYFDKILSEFQPYVRTTVTVFGAESTGKTTLSKQIAKQLHGLWLNEYARPYLENTINEISVDSMTSIWKGQAALQRNANNVTNSPFVIQDTDLFSTVGYWQFPHWQSTIGACPEKLVQEATALKSDLYIMTKSNIPFEQDPLRYGGTVREGSDEYWLNVCKDYNLPVIVLESANQEERLAEALKAIRTASDSKLSQLTFDRHGY